MVYTGKEDEWRRLIDHVFLPPQVPQEEDAPSDLTVLKVVSDALEELGPLIEHSPVAMIRSKTLLKGLIAIHDSNGAIDEAQLKAVLIAMEDGHTAAIKVTAQNSAVLITREKAQLVFESFELSPDNKSVQSVRGRLVRDFPANAIAIDLYLLFEADFATMLVKTLSTMSQQKVPEMEVYSKKSGAVHEEDRDTTQPAVVSEMFLGMLRGIGTPRYTTSIRKNTREEVLHSNAQKPWRRSAMWLLVRVALQLTISRSPDGSLALYKNVIVLTMCRILCSSQKFALSSELMHIMNVKIDRRRQKLLHDDSLLQPVTARVENVLRTTHDIISERWALVQERDSHIAPMAALGSLEMSTETLIALPNLEEYIAWIQSRQGSQDTIHYRPICGLLRPQRGPGEAQPLPNSNDAYRMQNLQLFEHWVSRELSSWHCMAGSDLVIVCRDICQLIKRYHAVASEVYSGNPEGLSVMLLTVMELWVACDRAATDTCDLLREFSAGMSPAVLQNLLLPYLDQMERLSKVEIHLASRSRGLSHSSIFSLESNQGFPNRFYNSSQKHKDLHQTICTHAENAKQAKSAELSHLKQEYSRLNKLHLDADCEYIKKIVDSWCDPPEVEIIHKGSCSKCAYGRQRDALRIQIHEWPLPEETNKAKAVVFELAAPEWFVYWRDARFYILHSVLKGAVQGSWPQTSYHLSTDPHLMRYYTSINHRIELLSETKPAIITHYSTKDIPSATESNVCVPSGLNYRYYDADSQSYLSSDFVSTEEMPTACTYKLPQESKAFQRFIFRTEIAPDGEGPNAVVASQDACPTNTALEEYKELATIPLGRHVQWLNILLQLAMPNIDFKKLETSLVLLQCIYQTGPQSSDKNHLRESHYQLRHDTYVAAIMSNLNTALHRVKENWESVNSLAAFIAIAARVLSLNSSAQESCFVFLRAARRVTAEWLSDLREKAYLAMSNHESRTQFVSKSIEVALLCISTFDVDDQYLDTLMRSPDAHFIIWASIVVQEGENNPVMNERNIARLHLRSKQLLHRSYAVLSHNGAALDAALTKVWSGYMPSSIGWSAQAEHWITTETATAAHVHYNLLTGELLVNGLPLDQPPAHYRKSPLFQVLFGDATVEVMPASKAGFIFSTKRKFGGCAVDLGMESGQLIVRATAEHQTYETIPTRLLQSRYPHHFSEDYVHWYNLVKKDVKFLPKGDPWNFSHSSQWILSQPIAAPGWQLSRYGIRVISTISKTAKMVASVLQPLADIMDIHCLLQPGNTLLHTELPNLRLSFSLKNGEHLLYSREHRSMFIDEDQSLGALVGFRNKMVLKDHQSGDRIALILESDLRYRKKGFHVEVRVNNRAKSKVHVVKVDSSLCRLLDSHDLDCKLFLSYLHALTSHCLTDPATQHTGTEQALFILRSKAVESFSQLSQANVNILAKIAQLSPGRRYYPSHMRVMQSVEWDENLPFLSQHNDFNQVVRGLLLQSEAFKFFYPEVELQITHRKDIDEHLRARANMRSSIFQVDGFGAENHDRSHDEIYKPRDQGLQSGRATNVATMSALLFRDGEARHWETAQVSALWSLMSEQNIFFGAQTRFDTSGFRFDAPLPERNAFGSILAKLPALQQSLKHPQTLEKYRFSFMAWMCTMSFASDAQMDQLQLFVTCAKLGQLVVVQAPSAASFYTNQGYSFKESEIRTILKESLRTVHQSPEWTIERRCNEKKRDYDRRRESAWKCAKNAMIERTLDFLKSQWPCATPGNPDVTDVTAYININLATPRIREQFNTWYANKLLYDYLLQLVQVSARLPTSRINIPTSLKSNHAVGVSRWGSVSEVDLFLMPAPILPNKPKPMLVTECQSTASIYMTPKPRLKALIDKMRSTWNQSKYALDYTDDLEKSLQALVSKKTAGTKTANIQQDQLSAHLEECKDYLECLFHIIVHALTSRAKEKTAYEISHSPRVSPVFLLSQLSRHRWSRLSLDWQKCIVEYGLAVTALQRAARLIRLFKSGRNEDLINELENVGHINWDPMKFPETLLIEAESGIIVRHVQEQIAGEMRQPSSGRNAVMQLNMGEGKSSVIVPVVVVYLADGSRLVRVIVAKPQSKQMALMLISKLGGLVDRRVYYLPYARAIQPSRAEMDTISAMLAECMSQGGVLLMQPEHILSFKLIVPEVLMSGRKEVAQSAIASQGFLETYSRDIVDESDENFSPRFELIYTMGTQRLIESSPNRWLLIGQVLEFARRTISAVTENFPSSIESFPGAPGSFPRTRILRNDASGFFLQSLATKICKEGLQGFPISRQPPAIREAVLTYITKSDLSLQQIELVENNPALWTETNRSQLLLLRGLFADGVLAFVLSQKRWRVNYGLADRTPPTKVAVPFRAKDTPALRSEFSHPDVVIALTLLSYYYQGLSVTELFASLSHLTNSDQAEIAYQDWVKDSNNLAEAFTTLKGINMKDKPQCISKVFPALRNGKSVIDYYVSHIVFPKEMKEFPHKLSASGWDIGKAREQLTTGFSGTIDSHHVLPLDVAYLELPDQKHTNALVMEHLLQPENGVHLMLPSSVDQSVSEADRLLSCVMQLHPPVQVILDVGAQVLELDNLEMAKTWLRLHNDSKEAVIFIDRNDEICVVDRGGCVGRLLASSYQSRLDACLVFLDEAHTRGIDLVLPLEYRAAVTLGPRLTKDRLVQACMRMRKLGKGQTVIFCVSQEIQTKILEATRKTNTSTITVADILEWSMYETLDDLRRNLPLWAVQGERFVRQEKIWSAANKQEGKLQLTKDDAEKLLETEAQSLEDRYRPRLSLDGQNIFATSGDPVVQQIAARCEAFDITHFKASALQEEQERELSP